MWYWLFNYTIFSNAYMLPTHQVLPDNQFYTLTPQETLDAAQDIIEEYTKENSTDSKAVKIPTRLFAEFIRNVFYASTFMAKDVNDANYEVDEYNRYQYALLYSLFFIFNHIFYSL